MLGTIQHTVGTVHHSTREVPGVRTRSGERRSQRAGI